jgi:hypothetical protein
MSELESGSGNPELEPKISCQLEQYLKYHPAPPEEFVERELQTAEDILRTIKLAAATGKPQAIPIFDLGQDIFGFTKPLSGHPNGDFTTFYRQIQTLPQFISSEPILRRHAISGPSGYYYEESSPLSELANSLGVLPRAFPDHYTVRANPNERYPTDRIYNVVKVNHPELPANIYWHEFIELGPPAEFDEKWAFIITVNKSYIPTNSTIYPLAAFLKGIRA